MNRLTVNLLENPLYLTQPTEKQRNETKHLEIICILIVGTMGIHYTRKKENKLASPEILSVASKTDEFTGICLIFIFRFCAGGLNGEIGMYLVWHISIVISAFL